MQISSNNEIAVTICKRYLIYVNASVLSDLTKSNKTKVEALNLKTAEGFEASESWQ
ncbi:MAG: hypothetical protein HLUCCA11_14925 [Phormidesmis priestleyi Ana]|uniref:Uncharacterized protein n=1 Tax=Phormidesmis priestleyi Ana TaxID=1666911 RepID=A0A0P7ZVK9_9CYAN|nr:MAG: hypothetical protein HLUCCA11_14925 [Phormidesmis priestleyi Ana]